MVTRVALFNSVAALVFSIAFNVSHANAFPKGGEEQRYPAFEDIPFEDPAEWAEESTTIVELLGEELLDQLGEASGYTTDGGLPSLPGLSGVTIPVEESKGQNCMRKHRECMDKAQMEQIHCFATGQIDYGNEGQVPLGLPWSPGLVASLCQAEFSTDAYQCAVDASQCVNLIANVEDLIDELDRLLALVEEIEATIDGILETIGVFLDQVPEYNYQYDL